jgi:hypothetical protein
MVGGQSPAVARRHADLHQAHLVQTTLREELHSNFQHASRRLVATLGLSSTGGERRHQAFIRSGTPGQRDMSTTGRMYDLLIRLAHTS